jgi:ribosomal-protein-alanine N-acetyltransferase
MTFLPSRPADSFTIRPVTLDDYITVEDFVYRSSYSHRHLDWRNPQDWVGDQPFYLAETGMNSQAVLACPPDVPGLSWLRYFSCYEYQWLFTTWKPLLDSAVTDLHRLGVKELYSIAFQDWYHALLTNSSFHLKQRIVVLEWKPNGKPLPENKEGQFSIRPLQIEDLKTVSELDRAAFAPQWVNTLETLTLAFRQGAYSTVVELNGEIIGYTISTGYPQSAHLARIAVSPSHQGKGIGKMLLHDLMNEFIRRGVSSITVNTQNDNQNSLRLYRHNGFLATGEDYPVFCLDIPEE